MSEETNRNPASDLLYSKIMNIDLSIGKAVELSDNVIRIVADNGNVMTGPGTNSYLIGQQSLALIDPGPVSLKHCQAILEAASLRGQIDYILLTHTHSDHSPGLDALLAETKAKVALFPEPSGEPFADIPVTADIPLRHLDRLPDFLPTVQAIHTPGHASNHLCFYLPSEKMLFTGDHLMNGSTVVIASPDGNMSQYLDSLRLLKTLDIEFLCPGHGSVMDKPFLVVDKTIAHRLAREQKVLAALTELKSADTDEVLLKAYADTPIFLHGLAKLSLTAHLEKLQGEGMVDKQERLWIKT